MQTYNVIYQTEKGPKTEFEFKFNEYVLFAGFNHQNIFDNKTLTRVGDKSIIVYSSNKAFIDKDFVNYISRIKYPVLLHCSNESLNHNTFYYRRAKAVLRSGGWDPNITKKNVFSVPLAFQSEFFNAANTHPASFGERELIWCFFGSLKGDRKIMYNELSKLKPNFHFQSKGWMDKDNKTPAQVIEYYKNTLFIPSPKGNIYFECNRTMDALEWGCIPVSIKFLGEDCYKYLYGDHPFIIADTWAEVALQIQELINDPIKLKNKQREVWNWYQQFKEELTRDVHRIIEGKQHALEGKQFFYQKVARKNWKIRWAFFLNFTLKVYFNRLTKKTEL